MTNWRIVGTPAMIAAFLASFHPGYVIDSITDIHIEGLPESLDPYIIQYENTEDTFYGGDWTGSHEHS